jgi:hypothetical protein
VGRIRQEARLPESPDLSQRPPRSPRVKLGGFVILPRALVTAWEINQWSAYQETRTQDSIQAKEKFIKAVSKINKDRTNILTRFDLLDLDDHITMASKALPLSKNPSARTWRIHFVAALGYPMDRHQHSPNNQWVRGTGGKSERKTYAE